MRWAHKSLYGRTERPHLWSACFLRFRWGFHFPCAKSEKNWQNLGKKLTKWARIGWFCLLLSTDTAHTKLFIILMLTVFRAAGNPCFSGRGWGMQWCYGPDTYLTLHKPLVIVHLMIVRRWRANLCKSGAGSLCFPGSQKRDLGTIGLCRRKIARWNLLGESCWIPFAVEKVYSCQRAIGRRHHLIKFSPAVNRDALSNVGRIDMNDLCSFSDSDRFLGS